MPVTDRDAEVYALYAERGLSQREVGRRLGLSTTAVVRHIRKVERLGARLLPNRIEELKLLQTERLLFMYHEAVKGWERSCTDKIVRKQMNKQSTMGDGGEEFKQDLEIMAQAGDPRFLAVAMQAIEGLRALWGMDAPVKIDVGVNLPSHANAKIARMRAEASRIIEGQLLSPVEQQIRQIGSGKTAEATANSDQSNIKEDSDAASHTQDEGGQAS